MKWPVPKYGYGEHVVILPLEGIKARVIDLHLFQTGVEYDVRYFHDGREYKIRVFEDEISTSDPWRGQMMVVVHDQKNR